MTKIYLAVFKNADDRIYDLEVFTNKKKAQQYKRYWDAVTQKEKKFKGDKIIIVEQRINNIDYTEWANKEEIENLPY